jgi:5-methylcytosine-specific restriction protein A
MPKKPCAHPGCFRLIEVGIGYCDAHARSAKQDRDKPSEATRRSDRPSRKWYNSKGWRGKTGRRLQQLDAEPLCRLCPDHSKQLATVADHVVPHRDDYGLFWFGALQSLCKSCHDIKKQRAERRATQGGGGFERLHPPRLKPAGIIGFIRAQI